MTASRVSGARLGCFVDEVGPPVRLSSAAWVATVSSIAVGALVNILTSLLNPDLLRPWWWGFTLLLVAAVFLSVYGWRRDLRIRRVAVCSTGDGSLHLFAVTTGGSVLTREFRHERSWGGWTRLRFPGKAWDIAAIMPGEGALEIYVADQEGVVWSRRKNRGGWQDWAALSNDQALGPVVAVAAISGGPEHREVFAVGQNGRAGSRWQMDGHPWSPWGLIGRSDARDVTVTRPARNIMECFVLDRAGELWHRWYVDRSWSDWNSLGHPADRSTSIAVTGLSGEKRHQEVYVAGADGDLAHRWHWQGHEWDRWYGMPSPDHVIDLAGGTTSRSRFRVIAVGHTGALWQRSYRPESNWSVWEKIPPG